MDMLTLAMAKKYADSQRLGWVEGSAELTANASDIVGKGESFIQLSTQTYDLNRIQSVTLSTPDRDITYKKADLTIGTIDGLSVAQVMNIALVVVMPGLGTGGYCNEDKGEYVSKVVLDGTIVPIDPKFLPGVCLPVVELSGTFTNGGEGVALTAEESALLTQCMANNQPIVVMLNVQDVGKCVYVCNIFMGVYCGYDSLFNVMLTNQDGTWLATVNFGD